MPFKMLGTGPLFLGHLPLLLVQALQMNACLGVVLMVGGDERFGAVAFKFWLRKFTALD